MVPLYYLVTRLLGQKRDREEHEPGTRSGPTGMEGALGITEKEEVRRLLE